MKKIFVSMLALTLTVGAFAQTAKSDTTHHRKEWKQKGMRDRSAKLNLTDAQKTQMKQYNDDFRSKMQALKNDQSLSADAQKQKRSELMKAHRSQVESILTPEQKTAFKQNHKFGGHKAMKRGDKSIAHKEPKVGKGAKMGRGSFDQMAKNLDLSSDQQSKLKKINEDFRTNLQSVRKNEALTAEQKKEQFKSIQQQHKQAIQSTLTAEQQQKLKDSFKHRRDRGSKQITK